VEVALLGGTGFIGRELGLRLATAGHTLRVVTRRPEAVRGTLPFPCTLHSYNGVDLPADVLDGCDAVVNLCGEGIADQPWTPSRRTAILESRTASVAGLARAIKASSRPPRMVLQASAVGYYGDRGDELLEENSQPGTGFLATTCVAWEHSTSALEAVGVRLVKFRIGMVLGLAGGALSELIPIYAKGLGAVLGHGRQWTSWIHIDDLIRMMQAALEDDGWRGTYNAVAPEPCSNRAFNNALADHGRYQASKAVPALVLRTVMGGRASLALDSVRVIPARAAQHGFAFVHGTIDDAFGAVFGRSGTVPYQHLRHITAKQWLPGGVEHWWGFFADPQNLERLTPPWLSFHIRHVQDRNGDATVANGTQIKYRLRLHGIPVSWTSVIKDWHPPAPSVSSEHGAWCGFVDEQTHGPYNVWHHQHRIEPLAGGTLVTDAIWYRLPIAPLGELFGGALVDADLRRIFGYRAKITAQLSGGAAPCGQSGR